MRGENFQLNYKILHTEKYKEIDPWEKVIIGDRYKSSNT